MGIYDQLTQLDKQSPTPNVLEAAPEPEPIIPSSRKKREAKGQQERLQESKQESFLSFIHPFLDLKASNTVSFRYPTPLLEFLEEIQYKMKKKHSRKITKNAILVAALAYALWDFEQNGKASFLYQQLIDEQG